MRLEVFMTPLVAALVACISLMNFGVAQATFKEDQLRYQRVRTAYAEKESQIKKLFADNNLPYPPPKIFIRVFKAEDILELWVFSKKDSRFHLVKEYDVCKSFWKRGLRPGN